jgi:hypothetical protein
LPVLAGQRFYPTLRGGQAVRNKIFAGQGPAGALNNWGCKRKRGLYSNDVLGPCRSFDAVTAPVFLL